MHPLAVLSHLRPRFAYILDHYGLAWSHRWALARRDEAPLYTIIQYPEYLIINAPEYSDTRYYLVVFSIKRLKKIFNNI